MSRKLINSLSKGLLRNINKILQDKEFYTFALNLAPTESITDRVSLVTEKKLEDVLALNSTPYVILGVTWLGKEEYVYFIKNKTSAVSEIWHVNKGVKTLKYSNTELDFRFNKLISSTYRVDYKGDRLIYFVDGHNNDRVINIDQIELTDSINSLDIVPYYASTNTLDLSVLKGGKLLQGNYVVAISFIDSNNVETNVKSISNSVSLGAGNYHENRYQEYPDDNTYYNNQNSNFLEVKGLDNDAQTDKAIKVNIRENVVDNYTGMNVYVIRMTAETTEVSLIENTRITNELVITGAEQFIDLGDDLSTVVVNNILYNKSEVITQKDNRLLRANTKIDSYNYNFQELANSISVSYVVEHDPAMGGITRDNANRDGKGSRENADFSNTIALQTSSPDYLANNNDKLNKSFSRDEVYALGVYFELEGGTVTDVYHIPGRLPNPGISGQSESTNSTNASNYDTAIVTHRGMTGPRWKVYNTAIRTGGSPTTSEGVLGYYRTEEVYPDGFGFPTDGEKNSQGKSYIRHHKIPSDRLEPVIRSGVATGGATTTFIADRRYIGLKFNINIPSELRNIITKVHYTYVPKNETNKNVLSKGIAYAINQIDGKVSDQLNRYADEALTTDEYEYHSAESSFKFKESNISGSRIKVTALLNGPIRYITKTGLPRDPSSTEYHQWPVFLNSEGANLARIDPFSFPRPESYNFKQIVRFNHVNYIRRNELTNADFATFILDDARFVDANSALSVNGNNISFAGNQNSVYLKLRNFSESYFSLDFSSYLYNEGETFASHSMKNYPLVREGSNPIWTTWESLNNIQRYNDSVAFTTLLTDNPNIDTDLVNLRYVIPYSKNNTLVGDSYIDVFHGKRGYSDLFIDQFNVLGIESNTEYTMLNQDDDYTPIVSQRIDSSQYDDYFAFFTETQLNIRMRTTQGTDDSEGDYYPNFTVNANLLANAFEERAGVKETYFIDEGYNRYNIEEKFSNPIKLEDQYIEQRRLETRIVYSEVQNKESKTDNYRTSLANNYRDLITTRGGIYQMFTKAERLYAVTRDSIFMINTSNQTLKTESGYDVSVGTGEFFGIEPTELIAIEGGSGGTSSKLSLNENPYGYVFVDKYKGYITLFNDSLLDINTIGLYENFELELEEALPELFEELDSPQLGYGIATGYDPELRRILITKKDYKPLQSFFDRYKGIYNPSTTYNDEDFFILEGMLVTGEGQLADFNDKTLFENKSITVSYDPIAQKWLSYHDYFPNRYITNSNVVRPVLENVTEFGDNYSDKQVLEVMFNDEPAITKVFDSLEVDSRSEDVDGNTTNDFFTGLIAYNEKQSTGLIELDSSKLTKHETYWNINSLRDDSIDYSTKKLFTNEWSVIQDDYYIDKVLNPDAMSLNKLWYKRGRLRDKYLIVRFFRNNFDNKKILVNFVNSTVRQSYR